MQEGRSENEKEIVERAAEMLAELFVLHLDSLLEEEEKDQNNSTNNGSMSN
jgi:hypothetical protein